MMFHRHWSGLPEDVSFPANLQDLGYFVNEEDEIRSIENPECYFKHYLDRNDRINHRQAFAFDHALEKIIEGRLVNEGLEKTPLPVGTPVTNKHIPIFVSKDLNERRRIVLFIGEASKPLGLLAGRVANGRGGINKGSLVSAVQYLHSHGPKHGVSLAPGIIIANPGQLYWYPDEKRVLTAGNSNRIRRRTLVDSGRKFLPDVNQIKGHETPESHVAHIFEEYLPRVLHSEAKIDVIVVGDSCERVQVYLDQEKVWQKWGRRMSAMLLMDTICPADTLHNEDFKGFLSKRARNYMVCPMPVHTALAGPLGSQALVIQALGMPTYSSGEPNHIECTFITAMSPMLDWLAFMAKNPDAENEEIVDVTAQWEFPAEEQGPYEENEVDDAAWNKPSDDDKPGLTVLDPGVLEDQRRRNSSWVEYEETGQAIAKQALDADEDGGK